jgi:4-hydroxybenzoate polyprenyltransferase
MSSIELIRGYLVERYAPLRFVPLAVLLFVVGVIASGSSPSIWKIAVGIGVALAVVFVLRVLDDTADLELDRRAHPMRVTVGAPSMKPLWTVSMILLAAVVGTLVMTDPARDRAVLLLAVAIGLGAWYAVRRLIAIGPLLNAHVLHVKYPLIALIAGASGPIVPHSQMFAVLGALYFSLCIREALDDPHIRRIRATRWVIGVEVTLLAGLLLTLSTGGLQS